MKKILINIKDNEIYFSYKTSNSKINNDLINTNIISNNELIFSDVYIKDNEKILTSFVNELAIQYHIEKLRVSKMDLVSLTLKLISKTNNIKYLEISDEEALTYEACEAIINNKHITNLKCFTIQPFMIELLDKNNIICETSSEVLYLSNFMETNNLIRYTNIYYKTNIRITFPLSLEDVSDLEDFLKVNKYLKVIHVNKLINNELENLVKILNKYRKYNLKIVIHENISDEKTANYLRELNKTYKRKYHIVLTLEYTKEYLDNNIFKQTIINTLKACGLIISSLVVLIVTYIGISNYVALKEVTAIKKDLAHVVEIADPTEAIKEKNEENIKNLEEQQQNQETNENENNEEPEETPKIKEITNMDLAPLLTVNNDVVGHLIVNNTNIDYPVVQAKDNDYYLSHNINREKNSNGWLFLDFRNNPMYLNKNNIIYGHNMYYSGVMFGTLHKVANKEWYTNPENQIITYDTLYEKMQFRIFSIYRVPKTNDYIKVFFDSDDDFLNFIDLITKRSIYNFNVPVSADDTIITLSTCSNNGTKRLVVHAVLIKEDTE